jgi:hypothetical protein
MTPPNCCREEPVIFKINFLDTFFLLAYNPEKGDEYNYLPACVQNYWKCERENGG